MNIRKLGFTIMSKIKKTPVQDFINEYLFK